MRISRPQMFMMMARAAAMRSTCFRLNVGAIVVIDNRPVSVGYNGAPSGAPHCAGNACPGRFECRETIHAEINAIEHVQDIDQQWAPGARRWDLYVTHSPCEKCLEKIVDDGMIRRVIFETPYRKTDHISLALASCYGMEFLQVTPAGYLVNFLTGDVIEE